MHAIIQPNAIFPLPSLFLRVEILELWSNKFWFCFNVYNKSISRNSQSSFLAFESKKNTGIQYFLTIQTNMDKQTWTNVNKRGGCLIIRFERIEQSLVSRRYIKCEIHLFRLFSSLPPPLSSPFTSRRSSNHPLLESVWPKV